MENFIKAICFFFIISFSNVNAQNYLISFSGTGASTTVNSVEVENLTSGETISLNGNDILSLSETTGIKSFESSQSDGLYIYPNPTDGNSILQVFPSEEGNASITILDMTGKEVAYHQSYLDSYMQEFIISGIHRGFYFIVVKGINYQYSGKLLSSNNSAGRTKIEKINSKQTVTKSFTKLESKGETTNSDMEYSPGDRLKFTGVSGIYSTVIIDIPTVDKTITFNFIECTDGEGNNYPVVEIGNQVWMAENLKTTEYNDKTPIPNVTSSTDWVALTTDAFCDYDNNETNADIYGRLYNWYVCASTNLKNVCPVGWHVPSDDEYTTLTTYLGGESIAGGKLKETGIKHWITPNLDATNETGFTALPGAYRSDGGGFDNINYCGLWWTSTEENSWAWFRDLDYDDGNVGRVYDMKKIGASVRCLKDHDDSKGFEFIDISNNTEWDQMLLVEDGRYIATKNNDSQLPDTIFYKPTLEHEGYIIICDAAGTPQKLIYEDYIFLFENFTDDLVDVAIIDPSNEVTFIRGVVHDIDFSLLVSSTKSFGKEEALKWAGVVGSGIACAAGIASAGTGFGIALAYIGCQSFGFQLVNAIYNSDQEILAPEVPVAFDIITTAFSCGNLDVLGCVAGTISVASGILGVVEENLQENSGQIESALESMGKFLVYGSLSDIDGNTYKTIQIGTQTWMAENLKVTKYSDGTEIPLITDQTAWDKLGYYNSYDDAYCYYGNDANSIYGALYTWTAAMGDIPLSSNSNPSGVQGVCPTGWHLPSYSEWSELGNYLIANGYNYDGTTSGDKIAKALASVSGWNNSSTYGNIGNDQGTNNASGFTALPGGRRDTSFKLSGGHGHWWSSTEYNNIYSWGIQLYSTSSILNRIYLSNSDGFSVRCVKD